MAKQSNFPRASPYAGLVVKSWPNESHGYEANLDPRFQNFE